MCRLRDTRARRGQVYSAVIQPPNCAIFFEPLRGFVARHDRRKLTVFFSDLSGFTKFTDQSKPELVSGLLNEYSSASSEWLSEK